MAGDACSPGWRLLRIGHTQCYRPDLSENILAPREAQFLLAFLGYARHEPRASAPSTSEGQEPERTKGSVRHVHDLTTTGPLRKPNLRRRRGA